MIKQANRSKMIKCKKCRKTFHKDMLACENVVCSHWLWKKHVFQINVIGDEFFCTQKCDFNIVFTIILHVLSNDPF